MNAPTHPRWMTRVLLAAAVYNIAWGAFAVLAPTAPFPWIGLEPPRYPELWQCIGMIVGVYGVGYALAARDPFRHWPIVLVGLLGKIFGPIGYVWSAAQGGLPWIGGLTILTNDLIWWVPFALILRGAARAHRDAQPKAPRVDRALAARGDGSGQSLLEGSFQQPMLFVFLRHFGCTFCREALADVADARARIEAQGARIVLVHMSPDDDAATFFARYGLDDVVRVSDPQRELYRSFELQRGNLRQLFGPRVWFRGWKAGVLDGHGVGRLQGDGLQMPGAFLVRDGRIVRAWRHASAADRPDYCSIAATPPAEESVLDRSGPTAATPAAGNFLVR